MSLSGMSLKTGAAWGGGPNSSYAAASIACKFTDAYNLSHLAQQAFHKVDTQLREHTSPLAVPTVIQIQSIPSHPISLMST